MISIAFIRNEIDDEGTLDGSMRIHTFDKVNMESRIFWKFSSSWFSALNCIKNRKCTECWLQSNKTKLPSRCDYSSKFHKTCKNNLKYEFLSNFLLSIQFSFELWRSSNCGTLSVLENEELKKHISKRFNNFLLYLPTYLHTCIYTKRWFA